MNCLHSEPQNQSPVRLTGIEEIKGKLKGIYHGNSTTQIKGKVDLERNLIKIRIMIFKYCIL